jgi:23S rRNA pseudouridine955/2504/2580 synthase
MFLHAAQLRFEHPQTAEKIELQAALPVECLDFIAALKKTTP